MNSRDVLDCLLQQARRGLMNVEVALGDQHEQGAGICFDEFVLLGELREELEAHIESLEESIRRLDGPEIIHTRGA